MRSEERETAYTILLGMTLGAFGLVAILVSTASVRSGARPHAADITAIQHVIFIIKENRSFDSYFGALPGVDGATTAQCPRAK